MTYGPPQPAPDLAAAPAPRGFWRGLATIVEEWLREKLLVVTVLFSLLTVVAALASDRAGVMAIGLLVGAAGVVLPLVALFGRVRPRLQWLLSSTLLVAEVAIVWAAA